MPAESILTELQTKTLDRKESGPAPDAYQGPFFWFLSAMQRLKSLIAGRLIVHGILRFLHLLQPFAFATSSASTRSFIMMVDNCSGTAAQSEGGVG